MFCSSTVFAGAGRRHDDGALAFADGRDQIHDPGRLVHDRGVRELEAEALVGIERREIIELTLWRTFSGSSKLMVATFSSANIALAFLGESGFRLDRVAGPQRKAAIWLGET